MSVQYKGGKCCICGYDKCYDALEFHHLDPSQKDFGLSSNGHTRSWEKVKEELDKCILVCANCHREIHAHLISV
jgi:5-methylcytosine-specific restriction endonuclease McrA